MRVDQGRIETPNRTLETLNFQAHVFGSGFRVYDLGFLGVESSRREAVEDLGILRGKRVDQGTAAGKSPGPPNRFAQTDREMARHPSMWQRTCVVLNPFSCRQAYGPRSDILPVEPPPPSLPRCLRYTASERRGNSQGGLKDFNMKVKARPRKALRGGIQKSIY